MARYVTRSAMSQSDIPFSRKLLWLNWPLALLIAAAGSVGFVMLYSVAGGDLDPWARDQIVRFSLGFAIMILVALIDLKFWRMVALPFYLASLALLVVVEVAGVTGMGAQRWINLGVARLQPSELMKIALVMVLALYYQNLPPERISNPIYVAAPVLLALIPAALVAKQPDLGTALLLVSGAGVVMFVAGVSWWYFAGVISMAAAGVYAVFASRVFLAKSPGANQATSTAPLASVFFQAGCEPWW